MAKEKKNLSGLFKNLTIIFSSIVCFGAALAGLILAIMTISKGKTEQNWRMFWIYIAIAVVYVIWLVIFLAFIGINKKVWKQRNSPYNWSPDMTMCRSIREMR